MRWLKLTVAYDGTEFSGWQRQPGRRTVQGTLEDAWRKVTGETVDTTASGRTDAGVHAVGQVVGLSTDARLDNETLVRALNASLPEDIVVRSANEAPSGFDATAHAISKRYRYSIHCGPLRELFCRRYVWHMPRPLDVAAMHGAAQALVGTHDFASFQAAGSPRESTIRTISEVSVQGRAGKWGEEVTIEVEGDGFLYKMVRGIVGTLVEVGRGQRPEGSLVQILSARNRAAAGQTAPPHGLFLVGVRYSEEDRGTVGQWDSRTVGQ
jgi:tRNA pseudouridine38-40 synthase